MFNGYKQTAEPFLRTQTNRSLSKHGRQFHLDCAPYI